MRQLPKTTAAIAVAAALLIGPGVTYAAQSEAWVKVEFSFKMGGKTTTVLHDIPVAYAKDVPEYCERYLFVGESDLGNFVQQGHPELANARFVGAKCVTEGGKIKWATSPTERLPRMKKQKPPLSDPTGSTGNQRVIYQLDLLYEKIVDGVRPKKYVRVPMQAASARAAESMCGSSMNMLRLSRNVLKKNPGALGLSGNWMAGGGKCVTGKDGYIEMTVAASSGRSN